MAKKYKIQTCEEMQLNKAFTKFMAVKEAQGIRDSTNYEYCIRIKKFVEESHNTTDYDILEADTLKFFGAIPDTSPARYNIPYQYVNAFFNWMVKANIIPKNPITANGLKKKKDEGHTQPVSFDDIKKILKVIDKKTYTGLRDYAIIYTMIDTGIRTKELLSLKVDDYDSAERTLTVDRNASKTKSIRVLYLSADTCQLLNEVIKQHDESWTDNYLLPNYEGHFLRTTDLDKKFRKYCNIAGVKWTPYQLRHTFASGYLIKGGNAAALQQQMGHADFRMTKRYLTLTEEYMKNEHKTFSPLSEIQTHRKK